MTREEALAKYPSPLGSKKFTELWEIYLPSIVERDNFYEGHLKVLQIFITNIMEYELLTDFITKNGYTYECHNAMGFTIKKHQEVAIRDRVQCFIRDYAKMLDIKPTQSKSQPKQDEVNEWSD